MLGKNTLDIATIIVALGAALAINRSNIKKETIKDLTELAEAQRLKIENLEEEIQELKDIIDGDPELVHRRDVARSYRARSGNSTTHSQATKNRSSR